MEGEMRAIRLVLTLATTLFLTVAFPAMGHFQEQPAAPQHEAAQLRLRKTMKTREYRGQSVEGEERVISPGDSLWQILIQEKGLSEKRFGRYLVVVSSLNPHLKNPDILRVGDTIFIPIRPDEILGIQIPSGKGETRLYRVKRGDYLYKILREEFGIRGKRKLLDAFGQVKELNPRKKNWNLIFVGEGILFPGQFAAPPVPSIVAEMSAKVPVAPTAEIIGLDYGRKIMAQENLQLLEQIVGALGNETVRGGEEVLPLQEGSIRIDRDSYPVVHNPKMEQRVILDLEGKIPPSLRAQLKAKSSPTPVVSVKKGTSLHEAVDTLLSNLGFQSLPSDRPVVIQDGGVGLQAKGEWMVAGPEESGGRQQIFVIRLTDGPGKTPDYLKDYLSFNGMNLKEILLPSPPLPEATLSSGTRVREEGNPIETWPRDKIALVDAFLESHKISSSAGYQLSVSLQEGIRLETRMDRFFEYGGEKVALLFRPIGDEVKKALRVREGVRAIELDLPSLSSRELIARLLHAIGERAAYREHRFPATGGGVKDKLVLTVPGFFLRDRSLLLTDRAIPKDLQRFFSEKGLRVVYFR